MTLIRTAAGMAVASLLLAGVARAQAPEEPAAVAQPAAPPTGPDRSPEVARALEGLDSPVMDERVATCKSLSFSGITDTRVYDRIERLLLDDYATLYKHGFDRELEQELGWCAKALAYAGNDKYGPTLRTLSRSNRRFGDHARNALDSIPDYARWNAIINDYSRHRPGDSWEMTRAFSMLDSGDPPLEREGLKLIKELREDPTPLHDRVEEKLMAAYDGPLAGDREDLVAWYCRSLAASRNRKYRATLLLVAEQSPSKKVRTYASRALADLARD